MVNLGYCFMRLAMVKKISLRRDLAEPAADAGEECRDGGDGRNHVVPAVLFLCVGQANIPERLSYVNWMLHMSGYVLFGGIVGLALGEWAGVTQPADSIAVGGDHGDYRGGEPGGAGAGVVKAGNEGTGNKGTTGREQHDLETDNCELGYIHFFSDQGGTTPVMRA